MKRTVTILYFAILREQRGASEETLETGAGTLGDLYESLRSRYGFGLERRHIKVAVDAEFASMDDPVAEGAEIAFIPPVAGG